MNFVSIFLALRRFWHFGSVAPEPTRSFILVYFFILEDFAAILLCHFSFHLTLLLFYRSFIVDKQPPQVLKTQTKFQASVR